MSKTAKFGNNDIRRYLSDYDIERIDKFFMSKPDSTAIIFTIQQLKINITKKFFYEKLYRFTGSKIK